MRVFPRRSLGTDPIELDGAMFKAAVWAAAERAAEREYVKQVEAVLRKEGHRVNVTVNAPDRLIIITDFTLPEFEIEGRPVKWSYR